MFPSPGQAEYQQYLRYLAREGWVDSELQCSTVEPLQEITGLKYARTRVLPAPGSPADDVPGRKDNLEELMDAIAATDELNHS